MAPPQGSHVLHRLIKGKPWKIFLFETIRPRALIFNVKHYLEDLYQVCSNYTPVAKNCPPWGSQVVHYRLIKGKHGKKFLSETIKPRALIFGL